MFNFLKRFFQQDYETLAGAEFKQRYQSTAGAVLLDVRTPSEFKGGALPKARNLDIYSATFSAQVEKLDRDKTYFVYCRSGNRSGQACSLMSRQGLKVFNLAGGIGAWPR